MLEDDGSTDVDDTLDLVDVTDTVAESDGIEGLGELLDVGEMDGETVCTAVPCAEIDDVMVGDADGENEARSETETHAEIVRAAEALASILAL